MFRKFGSLVAALALVIAIAAPVTATSRAVPEAVVRSADGLAIADWCTEWFGGGSCRSNWLPTQPSVSNWGNQTPTASGCNPGHNDCFSSVYIGGLTGGQKVCAYEDIGYHGHYKTFSVNGNFPYFGDIGWDNGTIFNINDRISSSKIIASGNCPHD